MLSSTLLVFTIIVLLSSMGIHHVVMFSWVIGVCACALLSFVDILVVVFLGSIGVRSCCSFGVC
jgi:hypothetical protein